jgi:hypothetical protein
LILSPQKAVDPIIEGFISHCELSDLSGTGKPLDLIASFNSPEEVRLVYALMKNSDILPCEAEIHNEIPASNDHLAGCENISQRRELLKAIEYRKLKFNVLLEGRKGS